MIKHIEAVWLPVSDMPAAVTFYRDTLGLEVLEHDDDCSMVTAGDQKLASTRPNRPAARAER